MNGQLLSYWILRAFTFPLGFFPFFLLRFLGKVLGFLGYYSISSYRKRALSNLAMAKTLSLTDTECRKIALRSMQSLMINCLEYPKLYYTKNLQKHLVCKNPEEAVKLSQKGVGIVFFCGHQANWEALFLDGTSRMKGLTIGKPTKNPYLYKWVLALREKFGGVVVNPKNALKETLKALKKGVFVGIVGDQGNPESTYSYPLMGRKAHISPVPALLAYKTGSPIMVAMTKRTASGYELEYSEPIWPNQNESLEKEIPRLMNQTLSIFEKSIQARPEEWLWTHNRWKNQTPQVLHKRYRHDVVAIFLPNNLEKSATLQPTLALIKKLYEKDYVILFAPFYYQGVKFTELFTYKSEEDLLQKDLRFKMVFNFSENPSVKPHYLKQSAFHVLEEKDFYQLAKPYITPSSTLQEACLKTLSRPYSLWNPEEKVAS